MFNGLLLSLAAAAQPAAEGPSQAERPAMVIEGKRLEKKVCTKTRPTTGTRLGSKRVCRTESELNMIQETAQRTLDDHLERERALNAYIENQKSGLAGKVAP